MFYPILRYFLFKLNPELSHTFTLKSLKLFYRLGLIRKHTFLAPREVMGISFPNPVGLAAGLDKNGEYIDALAAFGFGFIELGTVTPRAQKGNPKPRLFRLPEAEAIINRLGFNNKGVDYLIEQIKHAKFSGVLGINIGKNFDTSLENAIEDYLFCMRRAYPYASYITVNISSPNTPGLRELQFGKYLDSLLIKLKLEQSKLAEEHKKYVPLVIKIAPDLSKDELKQIANSLLEHKIDGVIATNTSISRECVRDLKHGQEQGGLSGKPLFKKSTEIVRELNSFLKGMIPIIAVGGIMTAEDAEEKTKAGASLLQIYTGFVYRGSSLIKDINQIAQHSR
jgi:dihydroorotate dehydrogenase